MDALNIAAGITEGLEKAALTLQNIALAKYQLQREQEKDKVDKRLKDAQIKKSEMEIQEAEMKLGQEKRFWEDLNKGYNNYLAGFNASKVGTGVSPEANAEVSPERAGTIAGMSQGGYAPITQERPATRMDFMRENMPAGSEMEMGGMKIKAKKQENIKDEIIRKVASGEQLDEGQQKIYDEVIKGNKIDEDVYQGDLQSGLERIEGGEDATAVFQDLATKFPKRSAEIKRVLMPTKDKEIQYDDTLTQKVISNIKTEEDFKEIMDKSSQYEKAGVDIKKVIKNFLMQPQVKQNKGLWQRLWNTLIGE